MRWILTLVIVSLSAPAFAQEAPAHKTEKDRLSYAMGMDLGAQLKSRAVDIDPAVFARGLKDALSGAKTVMTADEAKATITALQTAMQAKQAEMMKGATDKAKADGDAFLAANKAKAGVVTLPSGIQYKIMTAGTGKKPTIDDTVVCQYRGTLVNGMEFDSTYSRKEPATFPVRSAIKAWIEILPLMPVGSKWHDRLANCSRCALSNMK